jgi:cytochrome c553
MRGGPNEAGARTSRPRRLASAALLACVVGSGYAAQRPEWAFFVPAGNSARITMPKLPDSWTAPGSHRSYTRIQLQDAFNPPDWYPDEHPPMPAIVAHGSRPQGMGPPLLPCALCHLPNGAGHVESASLAGLPADYIERQFVDWRSGARRIAVGDAQTIALLTAMKRGYSSEQVRAAARYFASLRPRRWLRVVETQTVPASVVDSQTLMRLAISPPRTEDLGERIVELPEEPVGLINRDSHSGFVARVPVGSIAAGRALASARACSACHGPKLTGFATAPPIAGRPPTYIVRQLWAFQSGDRMAALAVPMRLVSEKLTPHDMLCIAAYLAMLPPSGIRAPSPPRIRRGDASRQ